MWDKIQIKTERECIFAILVEQFVCLDLERTFTHLNDIDVFGTQREPVMEY